MGLFLGSGGPGQAEEARSRGLHRGPVGTYDAVSARLFWAVPPCSAWKRGAEHESLPAAVSGSLPNTRPLQTLLRRALEQLGVLAGVEVPDEVGEAVLDRNALPVGAVVVDDGDAKVGEGPLQHAR